MAAQIILGLDEELTAMITKIGLRGFKCFGEETQISLKPVTIMYGKNGRGKSTISQSLLLLGQSMRRSNSLNQLIINDGYVNQGYFNELINQDSKDHSFEVAIESDAHESVAVRFEAVEKFPEIGALVSQKVNGKETFEYMSGSGDGSSTTNEGAEFSSGVTSDNAILQGLKDAIYISADRNGPVNEAKYVYAQSGGVYLSPVGDNIINVIAEQGPEFVNELEHNLSTILSGASISINYATDKIELGLNSNNGGKTLRPINVGFGYSYVLPVVVAAMMAKPGSLVIIENPEAHLHSGAQSRLAKFLIEKALANGFQLLLETHSDHVINGLRISAKNGIIKPADSIILHFSHSEDTSTPTIREIKCDSKGSLSEFPDDFMDEWTKQLLELV